MNNQMLFMLGGLVTLVVVLVVVYMPSVETYTKATTFASPDHFLIMDKTGEIKLRPVIQVDTAIDNAAESILKDTTEADKKINDALLAYEEAVANVYETKQDATKAAKTFQPKGDYIKRNKPYKMLADTHTLGLGGQDDWGEKYVTWTGSKYKKQAEFKII
tara:strand:- start:11994 stop:12476 length:483 start_codon:yes stop_codon:yes gene_type:complete